MDLSDLTSYVILSAVSHTAAGVAGNLLPPLPTERKREVVGWLSTGFGILMAVATGVDLLADLGLTVLWPPAGILVTGLLMGQGARFGLDFVRSLPRTPAA
jgi:succinate dehydrogenase/fumarate reductase flavoprotein subunit